MDLWYLPPDIKNICEYKYVIDIVDHFSKWIWSYPVKTKTGDEALKCLKSYIFSFGRVKFLHTDNGLEFHNYLIMLLENLY